MKHLDIFRLNLQISCMLNFNDNSNLGRNSDNLIETVRFIFSVI